MSKKWISILCAVFFLLGVGVCYFISSGRSTRDGVLLAEAVRDRDALRTVNEELTNRVDSLTIELNGARAEAGRLSGLLTDALGSFGKIGSNVENAQGIARQFDTSNRDFRGVLDEIRDRVGKGKSTP